MPYAQIRGALITFPGSSHEVCSADWFKLPDG